MRINISTKRVTLANLSFSLLAIALFFTIVSTPVLAASGKTVESALSDIKGSQEISDINDVNCSKVTESQLEELGDAVMGVMFPNSEEHKLMDSMMGGEGSESLRSQHIYMGSNYLGCFNGENYNRNFGMMGRLGMMGNYNGSNLNYYSNPMTNMMGGFYGAGNVFSWLFMGLILILGVLLIIVVFKALLKENPNNTKSDSPLEILQRRYAAGEIKKEEYEEKLKAIK
ncbi:MAG TPA: SHOCT domain-containing protein [Niabella sp.]|nr:SHOCT domain-containing protein [Candidatus Woesebacteria bacterium]HUN03363.1 SHOCT domain-containing protein [Niabella sp.]